MKKYSIAIVLCIAIIVLSIFNNISFITDKWHKDSVESMKDSLLFRQPEVLDLLLQETTILDSMYFKYQSSELIRQNITPQIKSETTK